MINHDSSLQYVALKVSQSADNLISALRWMRGEGSSILLSWSEDDGYWECAWISGGVRFAGQQEELHLAVLQSLNKAFQKAVLDGVECAK